MRHRQYGALLLPPSLPPAGVLGIDGRGEIFYRHHTEAPAHAPTLLLLHGWTGSADTQWFTAYESLGERYQFLAVDHRGHGRGIRTNETFTLEDAADDAAALIQAVGAAPAVAVGYSMGGPIALLLARRHPHLVSGLVLAATALEFHATQLDRIRWWGLVGMEPVLRSRLWKWFGFPALRALTRSDPSVDPYLPWLIAESRRGDPTDLVDAGRALADWDADEWAPSLRLPTTVMLTTRDRLVQPRKQRALAAALGADVVELDAGHLGTVQQGKAFADAICTAVDLTVSRLALPPR
jgi:pimeloyl-ACP methyl ester carboxylesterase